MLRLMKSSAPEWWIIVLGVIGTIIFGSVYPVLSILYGEVLRVFSGSTAEILNSLHLFGSLFIVMGILVGFASFIQVRDHNEFFVVLCLKSSCILCTLQA